MKKDVPTKKDSAVTLKKTVEERRLSEELFRALMDQSNDSIYVVDPGTGRILDCNEKACDRYGYTRGEVLGMSVMDFNVNIPDDRAWRRRVEDVFQRKSHTVESLHRRKDGGTFPVEINAIPVAREGGQYLVAVIRDISERKRLETERENLIKELQALVATVSRSRQEWTDTFDNIQDPIYITDASYTIVKANKAFTEFAGMGFPEVLGKKCHELLHGSCHPYQQCPHNLMQKTGRPAEIELFEPKGNRILVVSHFPYSDPGGFGGSINIVRDVTEEREKEMRYIMNERLASLGQMAASIAHEINNPLAAIMGCAEGLMNRVKQRNFDPALFEEYLDIIEEEIARCQTISTNMLSYVRKRPLEKKTIDVHETLDRSLEVIGYQGRLKEVKISKNYETAGQTACGNESEFKQVFLTVIANALDAMGDRGALTIETGAKNGSVFVRISDTGGGIPPDQISRIFDPFFTTKSERGGTGLGLSIAKKILTGYSGDIDVKSELGTGTTFTITLPKT